MYEEETKGHPFLKASAVILTAAVCMAGGAGLAIMRHKPEPMEVMERPAEVLYNEIDQELMAEHVMEKMDVSDVAAIASPSVVEIRTEITASSFGIFGGSYTSQAAGSGVILSEDGYIITNNHVIEDADEITVTLYDGTGYEAELIGTDSKADIAVIKVEAEGLHPAVIGDSSAIIVGETAVVIGNPLGTLGGTVTDGIISAVSRDITVNKEAMDLIQTNAAINSGNSGGGLFDSQGRLIGIVNCKDSGYTGSGTTIEGLGFAIPINLAYSVAEQIMEYGKVVNRPTLGVYLQTVEKSTTNYPAGVYITDVIKDSGAEKAGLKRLDRIIKADGRDILSYTDLTRVLHSKVVGDEMNLVIIRDEKEMEVTLTLTGVLDTD